MLVSSNLLAPLRVVVPIAPAEVSEAVFAVRVEVSSEAGDGTSCVKGYRPYGDYPS